MPPKRWVHHISRGLWRTWQFASVPELRWQRITSWRYRYEYYQRSTFTSRDRYPEIFEACRGHLDLIQSPRILSFGCATGEEVFTLAEYLPEARIVGVDINPWCIQRCNSRNHSERNSFLARFSSEFGRMSDFDAILCLAVLQRSENRASSENAESTGIEFCQFEREIEQLDAKLKLGGLFIIDHADFDFMDTSCSSRYDILDFAENRVRRNRPRFDRNNRRVSDVQYSYRIFVKRQ